MIDYWHAIRYAIYFEKKTGLDQQRLDRLMKYASMRYEAALALEGFEQACNIINHLENHVATFENSNKGIRVTAVTQDKNGFKKKFEFDLRKNDRNYYDCLIENYKKFMIDMKLKM